MCHVELFGWNWLRIQMVLYASQRNRSREIAASAYVSEAQLSDQVTAQHLVLQTPVAKLERASPPNTRATVHVEPHVAGQCC